MKTYDFFTNYYDEIIRGEGYDLDDEVFFLNEKIEDFLEKKEKRNIKILEVACGTGVVAKELEKKGYDILGLDISEKMLEKAEEIFPKEKLILGNMINFNLEKKFDVILCNNNSINHLLNFDDWKKFFQNSFNNLDDNGILIFDILTIFEFENITRDFRGFYNVGDDSICMEMFKKNEIYKWLIKMFIHQKNKNFKLIEEEVKERSFEIDLIKKELVKNNFELIKIEDYFNGEVDENSERVYFIARKKK